MLRALAARRSAALPNFSRCMAEENAAIPAGRSKSETSNSRVADKLSFRCARTSDRFAATLSIPMQLLWNRSNRQALTAQLEIYWHRLTPQRCMFEKDCRDNSAIYHNSADNHRGFCI